MTSPSPKFEACDGLEQTVGQSSPSVDEKGAPQTTTGGKDTGGQLDPLTGQAYPAVGFLGLFRFSTTFEIFLDVVGIVCAVASGVSSPVMTIFLGQLTSKFVTYGQTLSSSDTVDYAMAAMEFRRAAAMNALAMTILGVATFIVTHIYMFTWTYTAEMNAKRIRERYLKAILRQDIAFFDTLGAGEVTTRIQTDTHLVQRGISEKVPNIVSCISAFLSGFVIAFVRSWRLALAISSVIPCIIITGILVNRFESRYLQLALDSVAEGGTLGEEVISSIRTAKAFGTENKLTRLYDSFAFAAQRAEIKAAMVRGAATGAFFFFIYAVYGLAFYFGTTLILDGRANAGTVVNVFFSILIGAFALTMAGPDQAAITQAQSAASKLFNTIDRIPPIDSASELGLKPTHVTGHIIFEDVRFNYPTRPKLPVLQGVSMDFLPGKTAALVGASGSGKSTVVSLMERFYDPDSGTVRLDGIDIRHLNVSWLRQHIGLVQQEPVLFASSIRNNVAFGLLGTHLETLNENQKFQRIQAACIKSNADTFIRALPNGYDTLVGERGFLLSGGQKQRIAIARAIVSDPPILLLDEATSALDTKSEALVQDALDKAAIGRTTITVAHRLSTVRNSDQIFVMGHGEVIERGTHTELLQLPNGSYTKLVDAQKFKSSAPQESQKIGASLVGKDSKPTVKEDNAAPKDDQSDGQQTIEVDNTGKDGIRPGNRKSYSLVYLFFRMGALNQEDLGLYVGGVISATATGLVYPAFGLVFGKAIASFTLLDRHAIREAGNRNALWLFLIAIGATIAIAFQIMNFGRAAAKLTRKLRTLMLQAILRQDVEWFDETQNSTGALVSTLSDNPTKISGLAGVTLGGILQSIATVVGGSIIGLIVGAKLAAVAIACIPFVITAGYIRLRVVTLKDETNKKYHQGSSQRACEAAGAVRTVQSLTLEPRCCRDYSDSLAGPTYRANRAAAFSTGLFALSQSMSFFVIALVFFYGSRLVASREYSTFVFFTVLMSVTFGSLQTGNVFAFIPDISAAKGAANDVVHLLDQLPKIDSQSPAGASVDSPSTRGRICLDGVHFRYPTRPDVPVLQGLDIDIEPGTYVALVGASGSGKSTVIQLIERFYDPQAGSILFDEQNVRDLNLRSYREELALVSQEPTLYAGTIRFNILLGAKKSDVSEEAIEAACRDANILEFIRSLPHGFETQVGGKGSQLSGGQKQRIAIARALLRNPRVLLLDEATSALDSQSEKVVQAALDNAVRGRTTIAIAHRLSTIQDADKIYYMKEGRVSEAGTHEELLALRGGYYDLVQLQTLSQE